MPSIGWPTGYVQHVAERGEEVHQHDEIVVPAAAFADARQPDGARNPEPAFEHVALGAARRAVVGHCAAVPAVVRGEYDECVFKLSTLAQRLHHAPHVVVHVFDQGDELGAFLRQRGVPFGNPFEPFRGGCSGVCGALKAR